ncbi:MAG: glycosyltransferase family 4 protein, partial [Candidatus Hydrogenedentes bacterium]|nr:glycosyltransferase family 4 protein [Candidatus Hydrogenedentota bacterium]
MSDARLPSIALVVHDCQVSYGQGRYVVELLRHLTGRYEFHVFANRFDPDLPPTTVLHPVRAWRSQSITSVLSFLLTSERQVRRSGCALIHAQGLTCWSADLITAHVCNAARYAHAPAASWRSRLFPALIIPLERAFYRARRRRHVIAISRVLAGELRQHYGWQKPLSIIPHGTDAERFRPAREAAERAQARARYGLTGAMWTWLFVGEASKGLSEVIDCLAGFPTARVLVISRSPREPFLARAAAAGRANRVLWHGLEREPEHAYRAADAFVFPSNYDAFGLVVTEAMASGLPVIVSRHIGAAELIENRST